MARMINKNFRLGVNYIDGTDEWVETRIKGKRDEEREWRKEVEEELMWDIVAYTVVKWTEKG